MCSTEAGNGKVDEFLRNVLKKKELEKSVLIRQNREINKSKISSLKSLYLFLNILNSANKQSQKEFEGTLAINGLKLPGYSVRKDSKIMEFFLERTKKKSFNRKHNKLVL